MEHRHSKGLRFISILLVLAMLMTTATFTVLAEEAAEAIVAMTVKAAKDSERNVTEPIAESSEEIADEYEGKTAEELQSAAEDIAADVYEESSAADAGQQTSASDAENAQLDETLEEESLQSDSMDAGLEVLSSSDSQPEYLTPDVVVPFDTSISEHESITVNTGALTYSEKLLTFSGLSGAEEPLWLRYNSDDASLYDLLARQYLSDCDYRVTYKYTYYRASTGERLGDSGTIIVDYENEKDARALEEGVKSDNGYIGYDSEYGCKVLNRTTVRVTKINCTYTYRNTTYPETRYEELFGMSGGWFFDLPYMDGKTDTLYLPGVGKYTYTKNNRTYTVHVQSGQIPISMEWLDNEDLGEFGIAVCMVTVQDGTIYYFDAQKRCLCAKDRFDNTVMYRWNEAGYFAGIRDADGKETSVCYTDTDTQRTITIIAPDESETILNLDTAEESFLYNEERGWDVKDTFWIPNSIRYPSGESTEFRMQRSAAATHHLQNGRVEKSSLDFMLLSEVRYPIGSSLQYKYEEAWAYVGGVGANKAFHVTERYMTDGVKHTNTELYTYTGNYAVITSQNPSAAYSVNITLPGRDPHIRKYTFNDKHKCVLEQHLSGTTVLCEIETWYDAFGYPRQMVKRRFGNTKQSVLETTELFTHSSFGNLLTYISPKSEGISKKTDYRTTYTYNGAYNLPLTVEYKQDSATTVKTVNTLTADKKSIAESCTYVNNTLTAKTAYTYNSRGQMTSKTEYPDVTAESGVTTTYTYDGANLASETVTGMTDADGNALDDLTTAYTYDIMGRLLTATDAGGRTATNTYDARGRLLTATAPDGSVTTYAYDLTANDTTVLRTGREDLIVDFDSIGQKQSVYYASGDLQKEYFYDNRGRVVAEATGRGSDAASTTYYAYDAFDRVTEKLICDKLGAAVYRETTAYDDAYTPELSLVTKTVHGESGAPDAVTKTYTNKYGETVKTDDSGVVTKYAYDYVGNPLRAYYTQDGTTVNVGTYTYDFRGNVLTETNALGDSRTVAYDAIGRKISESDFKGNTTAYTYDAAGRLLTVDSPLDGDRHSVVKYTYDGAGNITKQMQSAEAPDADTPAWRTVEYTYDDMNRVTDIAQTVDDAHKVWTHYAYNAAGDLTDLYTGLSSKWSAAVNPDSYSRTHYTYNNRGKATSLTDALGQDETYVYDALGYVTEVTQRDGTVTRYTYNALGKPLYEAIYADADAEAPISEKVYAYYANGLVQTVTAYGNFTFYTYDANGNVLIESLSETGSENVYTYDARGRKSGYTLMIDGSDVSTATYAYDEADRLISVTEGGLTTEYAYDENGNRASQTTGAVSVAYTYNDANLVTGLTNTMTNADGEKVVISAFAYTYYADGNQYTKSETMLGGDAVLTTYTYDGLGRLTSETKGEDAIAYTYDANGNRVGMTADGVVTTYAYDANNRLLSETVGETTKTYTYDANGNMLTAGDKSYTYNERGQQIGYADQTTTESYEYNPSGLRYRKANDDGWRHFIYNNAQIVFMREEIGLDSRTAFYYYGLNRTHNSEGEIYVYNAHGDVVQLVRDNAVEVSYTYDAFGNITSQIGTSDNPFLYCGEYYDAETQTYYLRARYYDPANGRFNAEDTHWNLSNMLYGDSPVKMNEHEDALGLNRYTLLPNISSVHQSTNLFAYCTGNPVAFCDSDGYFFKEIGAWIVKFGNAILSSVEIEAGCGYGIGGAQKIGSVEAQAEAYSDIITLRIDDGEAFIINSGSAGVAVKVADQDELSLGIYGSYLHDYCDRYNPCMEHTTVSNPFSVATCQYAEKTPFGLSIPIIGKLFADVSNDVTIGFSGSTHVIIGGHYSINISLTEFIEYMQN